MTDFSVALVEKKVTVEPFGASLLTPYLDATMDAARRGEAAADAIGVLAQQPEPKLLACSSYYLLEGRPLQLFTAGLSDYRDASIWDFAAQTGRAATWSDGRQLMLDPAALSGDGYIVAQARNRDTLDLWRRPTRFVRAPATASGTLTHLAIGDSLLWRGWLTRLKALMASTGVTYQPIGTFADIAGTPSEGRSSWSPQTYTHLRPGVNRDGTPVIKPVTDVAAYLAMSPTPYATGGRWDYNPFLRPAVAGDPAARVHNGQIFDVRFYLDRFNLPDPDAVTIGLGTNPTLQERPVAETMTAIGEMVTATRTALPNARIGLCQNGLAAADVGALLGELTRAVLAKYSGRENEGIAVLPFWQVAHPQLGYEVTAAAADAIGVSKVTIGPDVIHPTDQGLVHQQWAEAAQAWLMAARLP